MRFADFDPGTLSQGLCHRLYLELGTGLDGQPFGVPLLAARGIDGPTLVVLACVHGDEFEGVAAIHELFRRLEPERLRGTLFAVPMLNLPAAAAMHRFSPIDHLNLARIFPGRPDGTITERIAYHTDRHLIARADLLVDLHSAGSRYSMPTLCGYCTLGDDVGERARAAAHAFGAPVVWQHDEVPPGRTLSAAHARGIPSVYAETTGGTWLRAADVAVYVRGLFNLLRHLGMLEGAPERVCDPILLRGGGNLDFAIPADAAGYLLSAVELLDVVDSGDILGTVHDVYGSPVQEIRAPHGGKVVMRRETPMIFIGEMAYALTSAERA
jgi:N2-acetyl-L-2,4-diaminobutanoate deacetylase